MPPKAKFTREEIARAAFSVVKEQGEDALTARELGKRMGTSARPIFTAFKSMEELKQSVREMAVAEFMDFIGDVERYVPAFKRIGVRTVQYGMEQPTLFRMLFAGKDEKNFRELLKTLGGMDERCIRILQRDYGFSETEAAMVTEQLWTQVFGMGMLCAMGVYHPGEEEIGRRLGQIFMGLLLLIRSGKAEQIYADVAENTDGSYHGYAVKEVERFFAGNENRENTEEENAFEKKNGI